MHKEEQPDMQTTLQTLCSSYTYLKIPKDHAYIWVQGYLSIAVLFSWDQPRYCL